LPLDASVIASKENQVITIKKQKNMKSTMGRLFIAFALFICIVSIGTCTLRDKPKQPEQHPESDSIASIWKKEKQELQVQYHKQIDKLQSDKDSLQSVVTEKKKALSAYRNKAALLEDQLKYAIANTDSSHVLPDSLKSLAYDYFAAQAMNDNTCDSTINTLGQIVANRDTTIVLFKKSEKNMRDLQREQELRNQLLTEELNTAYKVQKKKIHQNKFLAGGLIFISGLTTTLLIHQTLK
jgi:hypothetical protein